MPSVAQTSKTPSNLLRLLELLLGPDVGSVSARLLPAVGGPGMEAGVALAADHLVRVVLLRQQAQGRLDHAAAQAQHQVQGRLLLDVVVGEGPAILELLAGEDEPLLVRGDPLLVLDLGLDVLDGVGRLHLKGDGLASQGLDEDLHTSPKTEDKVEGGLLLDVVVGEGPSVLELLASEDQPLLVRGDALLVLDLGLDVLDGVRGLNLKGDGLASQGLDEDLHTSPKTE